MEFWDRTSKSLKPFSILVYGGALKNPENKHRTIKKQPWMKIYFLLYRNSVFPPSHVSCRGCRFSYPFVLKWVDGNLVSRHLEPRVAAGTHRFLWFCNALGPVTTLAQKPMENLPEWTIFRWIFLRICYFFWFFYGLDHGIHHHQTTKLGSYFLGTFSKHLHSKSKIFILWDSHQSRCPVKCIFLPVIQIAALQRNNTTRFWCQKIGVCPARLLVEKLLLLELSFWGRSYDSPKVLRSTHRHVRCFNKRMQKKQHVAPSRMDFWGLCGGKSWPEKKQKGRIWMKAEGHLHHLKRLVDECLEMLIQAMLINWLRSHFSNDFCLFFWSKQRVISCFGVGIVVDISWYDMEVVVWSIFYVHPYLAEDSYSFFWNEKKDDMSCTSCTYLKKTQFDWIPLGSLT